MNLQFYISEWTLKGSAPEDPVTIHCRRQISGPDKFSVNFHSYCLNKDSKWEWEPRPSLRNDEFLKRCRFDSFEAAVAEFQLQAIIEDQKDITKAKRFFRE